MSFARHTISLNTTFLLLSTDYSKSIHLQADRSIEIHTPQGCHYTTRIPRYGRDLRYDRRTAEALVPAVGVNENGNGEVFRLNLEVGRYMRAYEVDVGGDDFTSAGGGALQGGIRTGSVNAAANAEESHNLLAFGTSTGNVEFWDSRVRHRVGILHAFSKPDPLSGRAEVTALEYHPNGLTLAAGSSNGLIHLYDLRSPAPLLKKDQGYGYPIQTLTFLTPTTASRSQLSDSKILSADKRIIKIWDTRDGSPWTSVEPAVDLNSVAWCKDSGLLLTANEGRQQHSYLIPKLGPAPKWCSFLDNLVEEMAEDPNDPNAYTSQGAGAIYDNYKFLTMQQLEMLNLGHLVGTTSLLRPYMHGYFVAQRLYEEAKLIADPFVWEEERAKRVKDKIDMERESRIRGNKQVTAKVNRRLAEKMLERAEKNERRRAKRVLERGGDDEVVDKAPEETADAEAEPSGLLADARFAKLFQDPDFAIDERSREFKSLNPSTIPETEGTPGRKLTAVEEEEVAQIPQSSSEDASSDGDEPVTKPKSDGRISTASYKRSGHRSKQPAMRVTSSTKPQQSRDRSFGSRAERTKTIKLKLGSVVGEREVTFAPERKQKVQKKPHGAEQRRDKGRRSASRNVFRNI